MSHGCIVSQQHIAYIKVRDASAKRPRVL